MKVLTESIELYYEKYDCGKMVMNEYRKRLLNHKAIVLHRYAHEEIYCSFFNSSMNCIDIKKYDFAENNWNEYKNVPWGARYNFGSIVLNGKLFVMGGCGSNNGSYLNIVSSINLSIIVSVELCGIREIILFSWTNFRWNRIIWRI